MVQSSPSLASFWLVLFLRALVVNSLGQSRNATSWRNSELDVSLRGEQILLLVPGVSSITDAARLRDHAVLKILASDPRIDCVVYSYSSISKFLPLMFSNSCSVQENIGGSYLDHFVAASQLQSFRNYAHVMVWGPRLWVPEASFQVQLLVDILKANDLKAIAPAMETDMCPPRFSRNRLTPNAAFPEGPNVAARDMPHMSPDPPDSSNRTVGRMVDFIEWQAALFTVSAFECLASFVKRLNLRYWGSDIIFPTVCNARVGIVDLPSVIVRKCRKSGGKDYSESEQHTWHDVKLAMDEARRLDINFKKPPGKTLGRLAWPE